MDKPHICIAPYTGGMSRATWIAEGYVRRIRVRTAIHEKAAAEYQAALRFVSEMQAPEERYAARLEERSRYMTLRWRLKGLGNRTRPAA